MAATAAPVLRDCAAGLRWRASPFPFPAARAPLFNQRAPENLGLPRIAEPEVCPSIELGAPRACSCAAISTSMRRGIAPQSPLLTVRRSLPRGPGLRPAAALDHAGAAELAQTRKGEMQPFVCHEISQTCEVLIYRRAASQGWPPPLRAGLSRKACPPELEIAPPQICSPRVSAPVAPASPIWSNPEPIETLEQIRYATFPRSLKIAPPSHADWVGQFREPVAGKQPVFEIPAPMPIQPLTADATTDLIGGWDRNPEIPDFSADPRGAATAPLPGRGDVSPRAFALPKDAQAQTPESAAAVSASQPARLEHADLISPTRRVFRLGPTLGLRPVTPAVPKSFEALGATGPHFTIEGLWRGTLSLQGLVATYGPEVRADTDGPCRFGPMSASAAILRRPRSPSRPDASLGACGFSALRLPKPEVPRAGPLMYPDLAANVPVTRAPRLRIALDSKIEVSLRILSHSRRGIRWRIPPFWTKAPADLKWLALAAPVALALWLQPDMSFGGSGATVAPKPENASGSGASHNTFQRLLSFSLSDLRRNIIRRAAVEHVEDFRSGLSAWQGSDGWSAEWSYDKAGFVRVGRLALFQPSMTLRDYRMEVSGLIEQGALGCAVRAFGLTDYYAVKLVILRSGPPVEIALVRYPVIHGKAGKAVQTRLPMLADRDTIWKLRVDLNGPDYAVYVQGSLVDAWSEVRLESGGIGFFTGTGERARINAVSVTHQFDTLGRLCAFLTPDGAQANNGSVNR